MKTQFLTPQSSNVRNDGGLLSENALALFFSHPFIWAFNFLSLLSLHCSILIFNPSIYSWEGARAGFFWEFTGSRLLQRLYILLLTLCFHLPLESAELIPVFSNYSHFYFQAFQWVPVGCFWSWGPYDASLLFSPAPCTVLIPCRLCSWQSDNHLIFFPLCKWFSLFFCLEAQEFFF